ncbi:MAG: S1/P1 nuclease [Proteobacteria bacterium]|nr:S1/P1 nuclease [Pseudomonadota bacterium]
MKKIFVILLCSYMLPVMAWNATGHRIVANIAYQHLTPQAKNFIQESLYPAQSHASLNTRFANAAVWADFIKSKGIKKYNKWHYIDIPYQRGLDEAKAPMLPNIRSALAQSIAKLKDRTLSQSERVFYLRFLIHLVGDAHQPLHCSTLYDPMFPQGDAGGNLYLLKNAYGESLHGFWDRGLGLLGNPYKSYAWKRENAKMLRTKKRNLIEKLQQKFPESLLLEAKDLNPEHWIAESHQLAESFVYSVPVHTSPSRTYVKKGKEVVQRQLVLAGYRLAYLLNEIARE